jgi:hypothetical protein
MNPELGPIPAGQVWASPAEILEAIRLRRNGDEQAMGDLSGLQEAFGDEELTRILIQCGYALGYHHAAEGKPYQLKPGALAWVVIEELFGAGDWLEAFRRALKERYGVAFRGEAGDDL